MNFKNVIGIDVSKNTIDVCIHLAQLNNQFKNNTKGLSEFLKWSKKHIEDITKVLFEKTNSTFWLLNKTKMPHEIN